MSRACLDCGIPPWSDCVCDDDAGLDHPHLPIVVPPNPLLSVNGARTSPKDGYSGAAPTGQASGAPAASSSCADALQGRAA